MSSRRPELPSNISATSYLGLLRDYIGPKIRPTFFSSFSYSLKLKSTCIGVRLSCRGSGSGRVWWGFLALLPKRRLKVASQLLGWPWALSCTKVAFSASVQPQFSLVSFPKSPIRGWAPAMQQLLFLAFLG